MVQVRHLSHKGSGIVMATNIAITAHDTPNRSRARATIGNFELMNLLTKRKVKENMIARQRKWNVVGNWG